MSMQPEKREVDWTREEFSRGSERRATQQPLTNTFPYHLQDFYEESVKLMVTAEQLRHQWGDQMKCSCR
eukprot:1137446-Pelagomonas_calceolata.AAC.10